MIHLPRMFRCFYKAGPFFPDSTISLSLNSLDFHFPGWGQAPWRWGLLFIFVSRGRAQCLVWRTRSVIKGICEGTGCFGTFENSDIHYTNSTYSTYMITEAGVPGKGLSSFGDPHNQSSICWMTNTSNLQASEPTAEGMQNKTGSLPFWSE